MNHSPFSIFVINLKRSPERKANISKQLDDLALDYQYIEAIDGTQFKPYEVVEKYGEQVFYTNSYNKQRMTLGSLGCLLSHIKFYELMIRDNIPVACVLEDDAELSPRFPEVLKSRTLQKVSWGTLLLGHYSMYRKSFNKGAEAVYYKQRVCPGHFIARPAEFPFTTIGYLVKLSTARKLRDLAFPIRMPADWVTGNTELVGDPLKIITPPCIVANKEYRKKSTIKGCTDVTVPPALQKETPTLSLKRHLTVGLANIVLGTREQRARATFDGNKMPSTYSPVEWRMKSAAATNSYPKPNITTSGGRGFSGFHTREIKRKMLKPMKRWVKNQSHRMRVVLNIIRRRLEIQGMLWHELRESCSVKEFFYINLKFVLNIPIMFFSILVYLIQAVNRTVYYGIVFSTIRIYIKKMGFYKYTRVI